MNSYRDHFWFLLDKWINDTESLCHQYDAQLVFIKEKFLDYIVLTIHYTKCSRCKFLIKIVKIWKKKFYIWKLQFYGCNPFHTVMLSMSFLYLCKIFSASFRIYDIVCQIHHHLRIIGKGKFNCSLLLIVYDDSIEITIEDASSTCTCTFLIDIFSDYITIFHSLPHPFC